MTKSRTLIVLILSLVMAFMIATPSMASEKKKTKADEKVRKAVYHCDFGDPQRAGSMLRNIYNLVNYYTENNIPYDVRVAANSECVQFFMKDMEGSKYASKLTDEEYKKAIKTIDDLMKSLNDGYGVKFEQCDITLTRFKIDKSKLKPYITIIPSAQVRVVELQQDENFSYIKVE